MKSREFIIKESLNSQFDDLFWEVDVLNNYHGYGKFNDSNDYYRMAINIETEVVNNKKYNIAYIEFQKYIQGIGYTEELLNVNDNTSKVFGSLLNSFNDKISEINSDRNISVLMFIVTIRKRLGLYARLLDRVNQTYSTSNYKHKYYFDITDESLYGMIVSKIQFNENELLTLRDIMKEYNKELI